MGINHSNLYKIYMETKEKAEANIYSFVLNNLDIFTNDDITSLCNDETYKNLFEIEILTHHVDEIYNRFTKEEFLNLFLNATSILREEMFYYLIKIYDKELLLKIKETNKYTHLFNRYCSDIIIKIVNNNDNLLEFLGEELIMKFIKTKIVFLPNKYLIEFVKQLKSNNQYVIEIFNNITRITNFIAVLKELSDLENYETLKEKYKNNIFASFLKMNVNEFENFAYKEVFIQIIKEVLEISGAKLENIEELEGGATSKPYIVGSLVLKIGENRYSHKIPNHNRILKPLLRRSFDGIYIEVTDLVDTNNITDDDVYMVFKEMMDSGIVWVDARKENLGRLLKDNNSYGMYINEESIGLNGNNLIERKKGNLVILDTDLIFDINNVPWKYLEEENINLFSYNKMMDRYLKEKSETKHI